MIPPREGIFRKVLVLRAETEAAAAPTVGNANQGGGGKGSTAEGRRGSRAAKGSEAEGEGPRLQRRTY